MPGLESLMQYGYSPFGGTDVMETIGGAVKAYKDYQSPEAQLKRVLGDVISGKKSVDDISPDIRKLLGIGESKEDVLLKRYLEGDKSTEVLKGLGMFTGISERATESISREKPLSGFTMPETKKLAGAYIDDSTPKEDALKALSIGQALPGLDKEETKKLAGVLTGADTSKKLSSADIGTLGELGLYEEQLTSEGERSITGKAIDVLTPWATTYEGLAKKYKGTTPEIRKQFKEQFKRPGKEASIPGKKIKAGDTIRYKGKKYKVKGFDTDGNPLIDTSKPLD